jgi:hypothetical protein
LPDKHDALDVLAEIKTVFDEALGY